MLLLLVFGSFTLVIGNNVTQKFKSQCASVEHSMYHRGYCYAINTTSVLYPVKHKSCNQMNNGHLALIFSEELRIGIDQWLRSDGFNPAAFCAHINFGKKSDGAWKWSLHGKEWGVNSIPMRTWATGCPTSAVNTNVAGMLCLRTTTGIGDLLNTRPAPSLCQYRSPQHYYKELKSYRNKLPAYTPWISGNHTMKSQLHCSGMCSKSVHCTSVAYKQSSGECIFMFTEAESFSSDLLDAPGFELYERLD